MKESRKDNFKDLKDAPAPGQYDKHLSKFGDLPQKMTW
jgi:hypothetical protein